MSKEPLTIRPVANGHLVMTKFDHAGFPSSHEGVYVFTDPAALGKWVAEHYGTAPLSISGSMPVPKEELAECDADSEHNPDSLGDEIIGRTDGWRLLRKAELNSKIDKSKTQYWSNTGRWANPVPDFSSPSNTNTYRTKLTTEELAKLP